MKGRYTHAGIRDTDVGDSGVVSAAGHPDYRGKTELIHEYHRKKVKPEDEKAYGQAFAKGLFVISAALIVSGMIALFAASGMAAALVVLFAGLFAAFFVLWRVQRRYNGGVF